MANNTISQVEVNGTTYDLIDASTRSTVSQLDQRVSTLEDSVVTNNNSLALLTTQTAGNSLVTHFTDGTRLSLKLHTDKSPITITTSYYDGQEWQSEAQLAPSTFFNEDYVRVSNDINSGSIYGYLEKNNAGREHYPVIGYAKGDKAIYAVMAQQKNGQGKVFGFSGTMEGSSNFHGLELPADFIIKKYTFSNITLTGNNSAKILDLPSNE